jgi:hypothetical protein
VNAQCYTLEKVFFEMPRKIFVKPLIARRLSEMIKDVLSVFASMPQHSFGRNVVHRSLLELKNVSTDNNLFSADLSIGFAGKPF